MSQRIWHGIQPRVSEQTACIVERGVKVDVDSVICKNVRCDMCNKRTTGMWSVPRIFCFAIVRFWFHRWDAIRTSWMKATKVSSMYIPIGRSNKDPYFAMDDVVFMSLNLNNLYFFRHIWFTCQRNFGKYHAWSQPYSSSPNPYCVISQITWDGIRLL